MLDSGITICIDFDGCIANYSNGWQGRGKFGELIEFAREGINMLKKNGAKIIIYTARKELRSVKKYLRKHDIKFDKVINKPSAHIYIDDRAIQFNGSWMAVFQEMEYFRPWGMKEDIK